jgi:futalosine hydrolase
MASRPILILAAVEAELTDLLRSAGAGRPEAGAVPIARGVLNGMEVVLGIGGVGKASAASAAAYLLGRGDFRAVLSIGCAGAFRGGLLSPGEVVIADRVILADEGVESPRGFIDLAGLGLSILPPVMAGAGAPAGNEVPFRSPWRLTSKHLAALSAEVGFPIRAGPICTVSTASGTDRRAAEVFARWRPAAEAMEGAAVAVAAWRLSVPFLEVRGISNFTGDRDRASWDLPLAAARAAAAVARLVEGADRWEPGAAGTGR